MLRRCVGCNEMSEKRELIRVSLKGARLSGKSRTGGTFKLLTDPLTYRDGRSAYLHPRTVCYDLAVKRKSLGRSFRQSVPDDVVKEVGARVRELEQSE